MCTSSELPSYLKLAAIVFGTGGELRNVSLRGSKSPLNLLKEMLAVSLTAGLDDTVHSTRIADAKSCRT